MSVVSRFRCISYMCMQSSPYKKSNQLQNDAIRGYKLASGICINSRPGLLSSSVKFLASLFLFTSLTVAAETVAADSAQRPAVISALSSKVLLTDSVHLSNGRYIGVGLYGSVVYSDDGKTWQQGVSPTQVLLTNVFFIDEQEGWAGAHDTLILHTTDGGESWEIQYEDLIPGNDIPKPVLDIFFTDKNTGYAVGAYGLMLKTTDGGKNWQTVDTMALYDRLEALEMEPEPNFNYLLPFKDKLLIIGELGTLLVFDPQAVAEEERWQVIDSPYSGTFFGGTQLSSGDLYIYGLRGSLFRSSDNAESWQKIETEVIANIYGSIEMPDGQLVFLGSSGTILALAPGSTRTTKLEYEGYDTQVSAELISDDEILLFGGRGVQVFQVK